MTTPEFSRAERLDTIGGGERAVAVTAKPDERAALARRFGLVAMDRLTGEFRLHREAAGIRVRGRVRGAVTQACSVTGAPLFATVDEPVELLFAAPPAAGADEVELGDDSIDVMFHDGGAIDLGEVAAETLALALDPFPRAPGAAAALRAAGVLNEGEAGPFGALAALLKPKD